ncbi:NfeD family protein [Leptolyngbya sp. FACHB-541]|uniref:NfeD family protein n=1 Tax=Leptolyngbya sp. FACHB-541 TaxID=2692810 RepID=UPI001683F1A6|nr:NfeD family protein [Leptolyngbya sp. FACHB-541]MBD1997309.1 NfeD family protein [Leptolyngbya sp. FACHB-541]
MIQSIPNMLQLIPSIPEVRSFLFVEVDPPSPIYFTHSYQNCGVVVETIKPGRRGRIAFQATSWFGVYDGNEELLPGAIVEVLERSGTTWLVRPILHPRVENAI